MKKEICYECGESVTWGSGKFVNRIPNLNSYEERKIEMNVPYPEGEWLCAECDYKIRRENETS